MKLIYTISEKFVLPLSDLITRGSVSPKLDLMFKSQYWSRTEMCSYQDEKLRCLIKHTYENVPYYNELFRRLKLTPNDIRSQSDLYKIPIISKKEMKEQKEKMWSQKSRDIITKSSSGSTGEPFSYMVNRESYDVSIAANLRGWYWMGYRLGDRFSKISVNPRNGKLKLIQDLATNCIYLHSKGLTENDMREMLEVIKGKKPQFIRGYPSTISMLAQYSLDRGVYGICLKGVTTTGEILFPSMRRVIEKAFNTMVFDAYSGDCGATFFECRDHNHYHIAEEIAITEILNEKIVSSEGTGEIITTNLWNYAMPFIRYNVQDVATIRAVDCKMGIKLRTATEVIGRDVDIITTPSGKKLIVHFFTGYFEYINEVDRFQCIQTGESTLLLKLVAGVKFHDALFDKIYSDIKEYVGQDMELQIKIVKDIKANFRSGKRRFLVKDFQHEE